MWFIIRLTLAAIGFVVRLPWRRRIGPPVDEHHGIPYFVRNKKLGVWRMYSYEQRVGIALQAPTWIRMTSETTFDRYCKRIGIANEVITGDSEFDDRVFVICDHPHVGTVLTASPALRAAVLAVIKKRWSIHYDGSYVWIVRELDDAVRDPEPELRDALEALFRASQPLHDADIPSRFRDRFLWRAFVIESVVWAIAAYAYGAYVEALVPRKEFIHVSLLLLIVVGIGFAIALFAVLVASIVVFMRGSSRGHRVVAESALVLMCSLPVAGLQLASDINRRLDGSAPLLRSGVATQCERKAGKGGPIYYLHMQRSETPVPDRVRVVKALCESVKGDTAVRFTIGGGLLGMPYYRKIETPTVTWTPST